HPHISSILVPYTTLFRSETLVEAARRETLEESGWTVDIQGLLGVSLYTAPGNGITYCRHAFFGIPLQHDPERRLDHGIERAVWLTFDEIVALGPRLRSPMVVKTIEQYRSGHRFSLSAIFD